MMLGWLMSGCYRGLVRCWVPCCSEWLSRLLPDVGASLLGLRDAGVTCREIVVAGVTCRGVRLSVVSLLLVAGSALAT